MPLLRHGCAELAMGTAYESSTTGLFVPEKCRRLLFMPLIVTRGGMQGLGHEGHFELFRGFPETGNGVVRQLFGAGDRLQQVRIM